MITDDFLRYAHRIVRDHEMGGCELGRERRAAASGVRPRASGKQGAAASWPEAACGYQLVGSGMPSL